ncbi:MAG TPA: hypothetical protein VMB74_19555 [Streptosporangiaceae bacterium]|nr:hypothetical protein [Streptosporangiaceae bacterium]
MLGVLPVAHAAVVIAAVYGCGYGVAELWGLRWPVPGRRWQVPQDLLIGAGGPRRLMVWGAILGPGFLTRNPYAGFGMLLLLAASTGSLPAAVVVAAAIGAAHSSGRAFALLRDSATAHQEPFVLLLQSLRWRALDGVALLATAGVAIVTTSHWFG